VTEINTSQERVRLAGEDISDLKRLVLDSLLDGVIVIDARGMIQHFTKPAEAMFGYQAAEVVGHNISMLMPEPDASAHDGYMDNYLRTGKRKIIGIGREVEGLRKNGSTFPMDLGVTELQRNGQRYFIGTVRDISKQRETHAQIEFMSNHDKLTGLPNREKLIYDLEAMLEKTPVCVAAINLDFFNRINTVHGYTEGDNVLHVIASRLHNHIDNRCLIARDLGDRFWVVIGTENSTVEAGQDKLNRMLEVIRQPVETDMGIHFLTGSAGMVVSKSSATALELLSQAEAAVYQAKLQGRDCISMYEPMMRSKVAEDYALELALRQAIENGEIETWIQSKVDQHKQIASAEVLMRWRRTDTAGEQQVVSPGVFIPMAERLGLIVPMGRQMMREVAKTLGLLRQHQATAHISIAMNVSPRQFLDQNFVSDLSAAFSAFDAPLECLIIEITENLLLKNLDDVYDIMQRLSSQGVRFSIDDFGTGYSNLKRLQQLPIHEIKIDQSFVQGAADNAKIKAILDAIIVMSRSLEMQTVAEGVELESQADYLTEKGCDLLQGYLYSRPAPLKDWLATVADAYRITL